MTPEKANKELCDRIRLHLTAREITQSKLARQAGMSGTFLSDLLRGNRQWNPITIDKFCRATKVDDDEQRLLHTLGAQSVGWRIS